MKPTVRISLAAVCAFFAACGSPTALEYAGGPDEISIAHLRSMARGVSTPVRDDISVRGRVTANDAYGEFYKSIVVEDATGGIEILFDHNALRTLFPLYAEITVQCQGLALGRYGGMVELGAPPAGEYAADRIAASEIWRFAVRRAENDAAVEFPEIAISALSPEYIGRTVVVRGLSAATPGLAWCDTDDEGAYTDTERTVADADGLTLAAAVSGRCEYAGTAMPHGMFSLCGIVEYRGDRYRLRIANHGIVESR